MCSVWIADLIGWESPELSRWHINLKGGMALDLPEEESRARHFIFISRWPKGHGQSLMDLQAVCFMHIFWEEYP